MKRVDLTRRWDGEKDVYHSVLREVPLHSESTNYTGMVYEITTSSMLGTYIDFPGHIKETDDGMTGAKFPFEELYRAKAAVIHLARTEGPVTGAELEAAFGGVPETRVLIINALGELDENDLPKRSVYLDDSAVEWIIKAGIRYLISDIYESQALYGVFLKLFGAGVTTICSPANLSAVQSKFADVTCLFLPLADVTQLPCRLIAEF